jgi:hypothetical protein
LVAIPSLNRAQRQAQLELAVRTRLKPGPVSEYTGARSLGYRPKPEGGSVATSLPQEQWHPLLRDLHLGYISWEQYQDNLRQLRQDEQVRDKKKSTLN